MLKIAVCDDNIEVAQGIAEQIGEVCPRKNHVYICGGLEKLESLVKDRLKHDGLDIIFLDIQLGDDDGIALSNWITKISPHTKIVFITGYVEESQRIFMGSPSGLLFKPIQKELLSDTLERVIEEQEKESEAFLPIQIQRDIHLIAHRSILWMESARRIVTIVTDIKPIAINGKLGVLEEQLPGQFVRCHQSYLVNMDHVRHYYCDCFEMENGETVPISKKRQKETREAFFDYVGGQAR